MGARIIVHVTPKSVKDEVAGWYGDELSVKVRAVPEDGKANEAVCRVLADALGVHKDAVRIVLGQGTRRKLIELYGVGASDVTAAFGKPESSLF